MDSNKEERREKLEADGYNAVEKPLTQDNNIYLINRIIRGDYGKGQERIDRLTAEGYDPAEVQKAVDKYLLANYCCAPEGERKNGPFSF